MSEVSPIVWILIAVIVVLNITGWFIFLPKYINKRISRFQNELVNKHYDEVENMYRKMRGWRHDYHNHIQVLSAHLEMQDYDEAKKYLDMLNDDLTQVDTVIKTGNVMVDAILNSKLSMIKEKGINVDVTAVVPNSVPFSGIDLSVLIGNLLDNAMEACLNQENPKEEFIRIYIDIVKKQLYISVTNSMKGRAKKTGIKFISTKNGLHGFGLLRIDSIVSKYGGFINRQSEDGVFATEVMLPLISE